MKCYFMAIFGLTGLALLSVWQDYQVISLGRETELLRKKIQETQQENNTLQFECQRLEEPARLLHLNKTLGLQLQQTPKQLPSPENPVTLSQKK